jgi:hypothetical protein
LLLYASCFSLKFIDNQAFALLVDAASLCLHKTQLYLLHGFNLMSYIVKNGYKIIPKKLKIHDAHIHVRTFFGILNHVIVILHFKMVKTLELENRKQLLLCYTKACLDHSIRDKQKPSGSNYK